METQPKGAEVSKPKFNFDELVFWEETSCHYDTTGVHENKIDMRGYVCGILKENGAFYYRTSGSPFWKSEGSLHSNRSKQGEG